LTLNGSAGDDLLVGYDGADTIAGNAGNDVLSGGAAADSLNGGTGDDLLRGQAGNDTLVGGTGNDVYQFSILGAEGADRVTGFGRISGNADVIRLHDVFDVNGSTTLSAVDLNAGGRNFVSFGVQGTDLVMTLGTVGSTTVVTFVGSASLYSTSSGSTINALLGSGGLLLDSTPIA
jgi:Ca2+-binding RTX toxin-like protein